MNSKPVVIIGAGLAGLCCARTLQKQGCNFVLLEAGTEVGGRVRTDVVDGFRLDHGFQVFQTAYPEAQQQLNYGALRLRSFDPGALIQTGGKQVLMSDPWRRPQDLLATLMNGVGTFSDRLKLARLRWRVTRGSLEDLWAQPDSSTEQYLRETTGLSADMVDRFFRPWFTGVFLEDRLTTSSRFFRFIFRMFALGDAALPEDGMGAIAKQLAESLPASQIRLNTKVDSVQSLRVQLQNGETIESQAIVMAVDGPEAARLTQGAIRSPEFHSTTCFYYSATRPPFERKLLMLNGDRTGPINNLCVPSNVVSGYAPTGRSLISVSVVGSKQDSHDLEPAVRRQLRDWFGHQTDQWSLLRSYLIRHALPNQSAHFRDTPASSKIAAGLYQCGDHCETSSIHGAMVSGRKAAETVLRDRA
ncbi:MAG: FAD-dependent oxidoreductase [Planctomycetes bacterium]|nr:FAD-dependent oxidoreductase [Planctomycetota bacterium]